jgi:hypothetical protein
LKSIDLSVPVTSIFHDRRMLRRGLIGQLDEPMLVFRTKIIGLAMGIGG